ncbi:MAG TPA: YhdP family protein [Xanthomonadales bacterium]|nr:YhdP family protein [Xanthomonadales bacterium]
MVSKFLTIFRRLRTLLWTALTLIVLLAAVMVGVGKLLMPYSGKYQPQLEAWLSREFQQPVVVDSFSGEWKAFGPRISFEGVTLMGDGRGEGEIAIQRAALDIKPLNVLIPGRPLYSFQIIGADLALVRLPDGRYELSGLGVSGRGEDTGNQGLGNLALVGEVRLEDSSLSFDDEERGIHVQLTSMRGRLQIDGQQVSTELQADISDTYKSRVLGDLKATLLLTLSEEQRLAGAQWHIKTGELMISELVRQFPQHALVPQSGWLNAEIWGSWSPDDQQLMEGVVDLRESRLSDQPGSLQLDHLNTRFRWNFRTRKSWRIDFSDFTIEQGGKRWESNRLSVERNLPDNLGLWVSSDFLDIEFPLQLTQRMMSHYGTPWRPSMPRQARGQLRSFDLVLDARWKLYLAEGSVESADAWDWGRYPNVAGISGSVALEAGEGEAQFSGEGVRVAWPRNFRRQAVVDIPRCAMEITWESPDWTFDARQCELRHEHIRVFGRSRFAKSEGKPELDLNLQFSEADLAQLDDYWPHSVMSEKIVGWLSGGILAGTASNGRFMMRGDLDDWPFREGEGILLAVADVSGATLDYQPDWPRGTEMTLQTRFRNTRLDAQGSIGLIGGVPVQQVSAQIDDFKKPVLELEYRAEAELPALLEFIRQTPLVSDLDLDFERYRFSGPAHTTGRLVVPLRAGADETSVAGRLRLAGNAFTELQSGFKLSGIEGAIDYDRDGLAGEQISARFGSSPAQLALHADWDADEVFRAGISGAVPVDEVLPSSLLQAEPMLARISGTSHWDLGLSVSRSDQAGQMESWLELRSDLWGVTMGLPAPLLKQSEEAWPLRVRYPVRASDPVLTLELQDLATVKFELGEGLGSPTRANIHFGPGAAELPAEGLFTLGGSAAEFDMDQWMDLVIERFNRPRDSQGLVFDQADLQVASMQFLNRRFEDVRLSLGFRDGLLEGKLEGAALAGDIRYSQASDGSRSLSAQMERLLLPEPVDADMTMDSDPSRLPELHLYARRFSYHGLELGETRIEAFPLRNGLRIESVEAVSEQLNFQARGDWVQDDTGSRSDFDILITSESLGALMSMMEISSVLEGGQTMLRYNAWWPGPPAAFALARLNGDIELSVVDGRILNADPGAGRMVGLLSVSALPRRLALDFRDVFGSGFSFDRAAGTITLQDGSAYTDDLVLESTAATMEIIGTSDMVNKTFDYLMAVRPGVSQTLPALGAVIGGPGGAAAGLALQGLLRKSLGEATEARYTIRGPWSAPEVEPLGAPGTDNRESANE